MRTRGVHAAWSLALAATTRERLQRSNANQNEGGEIHLGALPADKIKSKIILHFVDNSHTTQEDDADNFLFFLKMFPCDDHISSSHLLAGLKRNRVNDDCSHDETPLSAEEASLNMLYKQLEAHQKKCLTAGLPAKNCLSRNRLFAQHWIVPDDDIDFNMSPQGERLWGTCLDVTPSIMQHVIM